MPPSLRKRKVAKAESPSVSDTETDTELHNASGEDSGTEEPTSPKLAPAQGHSKGEGKLQKIVKRLTYGTALMLMTIGIIATGHIATLGLVRPRLPRLPLHAVQPSPFLAAGGGGAGDDVPRACERSVLQPAARGARSALLQDDAVALVLGIHILHLLPAVQHRVDRPTDQGHEAAVPACAGVHTPLRGHHLACTVPSPPSSTPPALPTRPSTLALSGQGASVLLLPCQPARKPT